jgi:hypothetical protein
MTGKSSFELPPAHRVLPWLAVATGAGAALRGLSSAPARTWANLLVDGFYLVSLAVSALFFIATQRLSGARWSAGLRRIPEALMAALPLAALLLLALYFGREWLFPWSRPGALDHAPAVAGKATYLRVPFVFARMAAALLTWTLFAWLFRRASLAQDRDPSSSLACHRRLDRCSAAFVVAFAISFTTATHDWLLSLDPDWFSTLFAIYVFAGTFVQGIAAVTLATVALKQRGVLGAEVGERQLRDLGTMLFAFSTFWAYLWLCQYLLVWYANIPDEVTHYLSRTRSPWLFPFALNFLVNWVVPFLALLSAPAKANPRTLAVVSALLLCGRWLDLYLLVMPCLSRTPRFGALEIAIGAGHLSLLYLVFVSALARAPLVPVNDPILAQARLEASQHARVTRRSLATGGDR